MSPSTPFAAICAIYMLLSRGSDKAAQVLLKDDDAPTDRQLLGVANDLMCDHTCVRGWLKREEASHLDWCIHVGEFCYRE